MAENKRWLKKQGRLNLLILAASNLLIIIMNLFSFNAPIIRAWHPQYEGAQGRHNTSVPNQETGGGGTNYLPNSCIFPVGKGVICDEALSLFWDTEL